MYQFYYADAETRGPLALKKNVKTEYKIETVRPTVWEEHCLECSAPLCFESCPHYKARRDGRCHRFSNSISVFDEPLGVNGEGAHVRFRKWANMMTVIYPGMYTLTEYERVNKKNARLGKKLHKRIFGKLPVSLMWQSVRIPEFLRRRSMKKAFGGVADEPDAFILHCFSYEKEAFRLILEVYDGHNSEFRTSFDIEPGENFKILQKSELSPSCSKVGNVVKIYPENDREADIEFYWCDFVKGCPVEKKTPADKVKCVVWDLDNTLWDGILIETDNVGHLNLREGVFDTIKTFDERGIIQSISSKNDYEAAISVLEKLGVADYFIYPQISWGAKSEAVKEIARLLNIGVDTFAFADDSPFERNEVGSALPQVRVYDEKSILNALETAPFDVTVTEESRHRREMYRAEEKRNLVRETAKGDPIEFLKSCSIEVTVFKPKEEDELKRCFELVQRTNQLNMTGKKYTADEFEKVLNRAEHKSFAFSCKDKYGEYGIIGFGQYKFENEALVFTEFAMSCRVAGKFVESALFSSLLESEKCKDGKFCVVITEKNKLLRNTLESIGFNAEIKSSDSICYSFSSELKNKDLVSVGVNYGQE